MLDKTAADKSKSWIRTLIDGSFLIAAAVLGFLTGQQGIDILVPGLLLIGTLFAVRLSLKEPYSKTFTAYMGLAAFSYYYFYCSALFGRNPTNASWLPGKMATPIEQAQKDLLFIAVMFIGLIKLINFKMENHLLLKKRLNNPIMKSLLLLIAFNVIRAIFLLFEGESVFNILLYLRNSVEVAIVPIVLCTALIRNEKDLRTIYKGIFYTLGIVAVLGIVEFFIQGSVFIKDYAGGIRIHRAAATLQNPNNLGSYLGVAIGIFILYFYRNQLRMWERNLFWLSVPLAFACLFMTMSRSSILSFFITLTILFTLLFITFEREKGKSRLQACQNLMVAYILILSISGFILYKFFNFDSALRSAADMYIGSSNQAGFRTYAAVAIIKQLLANPLALIMGYSKLMARINPDNAIAFLLLRNGLLGFLLYAYIWFKSLKIAWDRIMDKKAVHSFLYMVSFYILTFQFIFGFTSTIHDNFPGNVYFWVAVGTIIWLESSDATKRRLEGSLPEIANGPPIDEPRQA